MIQKEPGCLDQLEKLRESENEEIRRLVKGALWILKDEAHTKSEERGEGMTMFLIFSE